MQKDVIMYRAERKCTIAPILFGLFLITVVVLSLLSVFLNSGPIVLGSEMNTDGHVEYLCLGSGCDQLADFSWVD